MNNISNNNRLLSFKIEQIQEEINLRKKFLENNRFAGVNRSLKKQEEYITILENKKGKIIKKLVFKK